MINRNIISTVFTVLSPIIFAVIINLWLQNQRKLAQFTALTTQQVLLNGPNRTKVLHDYKIEINRRRLDRPIFYFSIVPNYWAVWISSIENPMQTVAFSKLLQRIKNEQATKEIYIHVQNEMKGKSMILNVPWHLPWDNIVEYFAKQDIDIQPIYLKAISQSCMFYYPKIVFHGLDNQFHFTLGSYLIGEFGYSLQTKEPIATLIFEGMFWSFLLGISGYMISLIFGIFLAVRLSIDASSKWGIVAQIQDAISIVPIFSTAGLLLVLFTNDIYGLAIFPILQVGMLQGNFWENAQEIFLSLLLPIICIFIGTSAYFTRQISQSINSEKSKPYYLTAKMKSIDESQVIYRHLLLNAIRPIMGILIINLPQLLLGSVVVELVFNIPGLAYLMRNAVINHDTGLVGAIVFVFSILFSLSYMVHLWLDKIIYPHCATTIE